MAYWGILLTLLLPVTGNDSKKTAKELMEDRYDYVIYYDFIGKINKEDSTKIVRERMVLLSGQNGSKYLSNNKLLADSILLDQYNNPKMMNGAPSFSQQGVPKVKVNHQVAKNFSTSTYKFNNILGIQQFSFSDSLPVLNWKPEEEKKEVLGYVCQKATTHFSGRDYIAWFAPAIPIPDGPYKFSGLPGLILEIYDTKAEYRFLSVGLEKATRKIAALPKNSMIKELKNSNDYKIVYNRFKNNPAPFFEIDNMKLPPELIERAIKNASEMLKLHNNPLELDE